MSSESENLIGILEEDVEIEGTAEEFLHIFTHKPHHISNVSSDKIQDCELLEGEWGTVGSIINWSYHHDGQARVAKERVEAIDKENHLIKFSVLEGDLMEHFKSFVLTIQGIPKAENPKHCVIHWHIEYEKLHGEIIDPHTLLQFTIDVSKDIEVHIREDKAVDDKST